MSHKTCLLINPWVYDFAAYDFWAKPLGLLYLASYLRRKGFRVILWDAMSRKPHLSQGNAPAVRSYGTGKFHKKRVENPAALSHVPRTYSRYGLGQEYLEAELKDAERPDFILVTSLMTYWYPGVIEAVCAVKRIFPEVPVLLGGIYATLCTEHARLYSGADYVLPGPGEAALGKFLQVNMDDSLHDQESSPERAYPAFDMIPGLRYVCLVTSWGCPYGCHYCASKLLNPGFRERDPNEISEEIIFWHTSRRIRDFAFYDDALLVNAQKRIIPLLEGLLRRGVSVRFHTPNGLHLREITPDVARLLYETGFTTIRLGYESSDMDWHGQTGGKVRSGDLESALTNLWKAGFTRDQVGVYVLMGLPGQRLCRVEEAVREIKSLGARSYLSEYSPIPGTWLWEDARRYSQYDLENEPLFHNNSLLPCAGEEFTPDAVQRLKRLRD